MLDDPARFRLGVEAARLALAYEYDPYFTLSIARVDPLPHQLEAVYDYFMKLPRIRFLLADDPGAGKTIMAGLLLKELKIRGLIKRTLIVAPANLGFQWQREMKDKFREHFEVIRSDVLRAKLERTLLNVTAWTGLLGRESGSSTTRSARLYAALNIRSAVGGSNPPGVATFFFPGWNASGPSLRDLRFEHLRNERGAPVWRPEFLFSAH